MESLMKKLGKLRKQIVAQRQKTGKLAGVVKCPYCGSPLHYRESSNGHITGRCEKTDCLYWME